MAEYWKGPGCARFLPNKHIAHKERERERIYMIKYMYSGMANINIQYICLMIQYVVLYFNIV